VPLQARSGSWAKPSTAPDGEDARKLFRVTHPFHPLFGREFEHVSYRHNWDEDRVYYLDTERHLRRMPASWTSLVAIDPFVTIAAGRSFFRYEDLVKLAHLLEGLPR
jgi:hypothetical protein